MDDFGFDQPELNGALISMEFGTGGRIQKLWVMNPDQQRDSEEFQFVAPSIPMGEEVADDYFPGTILIGARSHPDAPWVLGRNTQATVTEEDDDGQGVGFEYDFGDLEDIDATGRFREVRNGAPYVLWDITVRNRGRRIVEIGELAFPMALADIGEGFLNTDDGRRRAWRDRLHLHQAIAGAGSYIHARRASGKSPALTIFPGVNTSWEFTNRVRASLTTGFRWGGIPIVYVHSRAAMEREEWMPWLGEPTTAILEPGETREYQIGFAPADGSTPEGLAQSLFGVGQPAFRVFPSAVIPHDVGTTIEVGGVTPARIWSAGDSPINTEADPEGGSCFVKGRKAGPEIVYIEDTDGRVSQAHVLFTPPIRKLIEARAKYIIAHQIIRSGPLKDAIVPGDNRAMRPFTEPGTRMMFTTIAYGIADALFLADKNTLYPMKSEIAVLDRYVEKFLEQKIVNPADGSVGSLLPEEAGVAVETGRVKSYPLVVGLYTALARISEVFDGLSHDAEHYLRRAGLVSRRMSEFTHDEGYRDVGAPEIRLAWDARRAYRNLAKLDSDKLGETDVTSIEVRHSRLAKLRYPYGGPGNWSNDSFDEVIRAKRGGTDNAGLRHLFAARMTSPNWWWNGSDKRWFDEQTLPVDLAFGDRGETCLGGANVTNAVAFFDMLDKDPITPEDERMRAAYGGFIGVWGLVREDGAGAGSFCPDAASVQFGYNWCTGDVGAGLSRYLRSSATWVMPIRGSGIQAFGGSVKFDTKRRLTRLIVRPWDGVGRRIVIRQLGLELRTTFGYIEQFVVDTSKRHATVKLTNPSDRDQVCEVSLEGMWGVSIQSDDETLDNRGARAVRSLTLGPKASVTIPFESL